VQILLGLEMDLARILLLEVFLMVMVFIRQEGALIPLLEVALARLLQLEVALAHIMVLEVALT